jgi:acyl carrier protein
MVAELTKDAVKQNVKDFIVQSFLFGDDGAMVGDGESFLEQGIIDSTGILEVIEHIEEQYSISVEDSELIPENLDSLENISAFVIRKSS